MIERSKRETNDSATHTSQPTSLCQPPRTSGRQRRPSSLRKRTRFKERPPAPATDVGEEGNCVAADREADGLPDRPRERVDPLRRQDLSRGINNLRRGTGERLGQLDGLERLAERDFGLAHDEVGLVVETSADHPASCRHVVCLGDDWH